MSRETDNGVGMPLLGDPEDSESTLPGVPSFLDEDTSPQPVIVKTHDGRSRMSLAKRTSEPPPQDAHGPAPPGTTYLGDRYRVLRLLGEGGFARVYLAMDEQLHREVALKELNEAGLASPEVLVRFQNEARAAAKLRHDAIVQVYDVFDDEARGPVIVMEYAPGGDLSTLVESSGPLAPIRAAWMFERIAAGLAEAHRVGIIHRDVKPQNILLTASGDPKLTDFGIAHVEVPSSREITQSKMQMGTPDYMAPEVMFGASFATPLSDIYALGASLYLAVTGARPRVVRLEAVASPLRAAVSRCMHEDPALRYASATELADALRAVADAISGAERRLIPPIGLGFGVVRRNPGLSSFLAGTFAMTVAVVVVLLARVSPAPEQAIEVKPLALEIPAQPAAPPPPPPPMPQVIVPEPEVQGPPTPTRPSPSPAPAVEPKRRAPTTTSPVAMCINAVQRALDHKKPKIAAPDLECLREIDQASPSWVQSRVLLAMGLKQMGEAAQAEQILESTALDDRAKEDPEVQLRLAQVLSASKKGSTARRCVRRAEIAWANRSRISEAKKVLASLEIKRVLGICAERVHAADKDPEYLAMAESAFNDLRRMAEDAGDKKIRDYAKKRLEKLAR